jgi:Domain of unknown function (DUF4349)
MNANKLVVLLGPVVGLLLIGACGGSSGGAMSAGAPQRSTSNAYAPAPAPAKSTTGGASDATTPVAPATAEGPRVQKNASLTLTVSNGAFDSSLDRVVALVDSRGGYISGSLAQADSGDRVRSGQVTFQVPADRFGEVLAQVKKVGTLQHQAINSNDVSLQYVDLQARLRNAEAQRDATLTLMGQAHSVGDIIQVQNQLGQITGQIEQLKGQIAYLDHTTTYATLAVTIREAAASTTTDEWGLRTAAVQGLHNFTAVLGFVLVALGTLGPVLLVGAVGLVAWRLRLRVRRAS